MGERGLGRKSGMPVCCGLAERCGCEPDGGFGRDRISSVLFREGAGGAASSGMMMESIGRREVVDERRFGEGKGEAT